MTPDDPAATRSRRGRFRSRLLALIALILVVAALKATYPISMPVLVAILIVAAVWPLKVLLDRAVPSWLSYVLVLLLLVVLLAGFVVAIYFASNQVVAAMTGDWPKIEQRYGAIMDRLNEFGLNINRDAIKQGVTGAAKAALGSLYSTTTYIAFIGLLLILGLPEVPRLGGSLRAAFGRHAREETIDFATQSSRQIRTYLGVMLVTSLLTGIGSALVALATGLKFPVIWGILNFLLNFVPVIGNIVGIIPPTVYAMLQFGGATMPIVVFAAFALLQITISNFVYPLLQGDRLSISPVVIVVAVAFWGWMWGIAGALIAVPLTAALIIACAHFERTRWIAQMLSSGNGKKWRARNDSNVRPSDS